MKILIAIHGAHSQPEFMQAQRETWLADIEGADYKFFLGYPETEAEDIVLVDSEDGPIWEGGVGGRRTWIPNVKTEAIVSYALDNGYDFVFKCDDDTYVRAGALLAGGFEEHDYSGFTEKHYTIALGFYRWAQGGSGYWLSRRALEVIAEHGLRTVVLPEDFAVGNALATHGIHPYHDDRYAPGVTKEELEHPDPRLLTLHKVSPDWMRRLHSR